VPNTTRNDSAQLSIVPQTGAGPPIESQVEFRSALELGVNRLTMDSH